MKRKTGKKNMRAAAIARAESLRVERFSRIVAEIRLAIGRHGEKPKFEAVAEFVKASEGWAFAWRKRAEARGAVQVEGDKITWSRAKEIEADAGAAWRAAHAGAFVRSGYVLPSALAISPRPALEKAAAGEMGADSLESLRHLGAVAVRGALRGMRPAVRGGGVLPDGAAVLPFGEWLEWRRALVRARREARRLLWAGGGERAIFASMADLEQLAGAGGIDKSERVAGGVELRAGAADLLSVHWSRGDNYHGPRALARRVAWARWCLLAFHLSGGWRQWRASFRADRRRLAVVARIARGEGVELLGRVGVALAADDSGAVRDAQSVANMSTELMRRIGAGDVLLTEKPDSFCDRLRAEFGARMLAKFESESFGVAGRGDRGAGAELLEWARGRETARIDRAAGAELLAGILGRGVAVAVRVAVPVAVGADCEFQAFNGRGGAVFLASIGRNEKGAATGWRVEAAARAAELAEKIAIVAGGRMPARAASAVARAAKRARAVRK